MSCASYEAVWFQILNTCKNLTEHRMKFSGSAWKMMHFLSGVTLYVCFSTFTWLCIIFFPSSPTICHSGSFLFCFSFLLLSMYALTNYIFCSGTFIKCIVWCTFWPKKKLNGKNVTYFGISYDYKQLVIWLLLCISWNSDTCKNFDPIFFCMQS